MMVRDIGWPRYRDKCICVNGGAHAVHPCTPSIRDFFHIRDVTLIITGGLRVPEDFAKALAMGADGVAVSNSALQAIGCVAARMCNTNNCPAGIATQKPELRALLNIDAAAVRLATFFDTSIQLMQILARACGHDQLSKLCQSDLTTWKNDMAKLSGISFGGIEP